LDGTEIEFPLQVSADAPVGLSRIRFRARGVMDGHTVEHVVHANYSWTSTQKIWGPAETVELYATIAEAPKLVMEVADRVSVQPGKPGTIKVVVTRLDESDEPLQLRAMQLASGLVLEPAIVPAGITLVDVAFTAAAVPASLVLEGVVAGHILGKTHPIAIDSANRGAPKVTVDEN
jgi:hypothetical protein